jgi:hypothetical protein
MPHSRLPLPLDSPHPIPCRYVREAEAIISADYNSVIRSGKSQKCDERTPHATTTERWSLSLLAANIKTSKGRAVVNRC